MSDELQEPLRDKWAVRLSGAIPTLGLDDTPPTQAHEHPSSVWHLIYAEPQMREWIDLGRIAHPWQNVPGRFALWILRDDYSVPYWENLIEIDTHTQRWRSIAIRHFGQDNPRTWDELPKMTKDCPWFDILTTDPEFRETLLHATDVCLARHPAPPIDTSHIKHIS